MRVMPSRRNRFILSMPVNEFIDLLNQSSEAIMKFHAAAGMTASARADRENVILIQLIPKPSRWHIERWNSDEMKLVFV